MCFHGIYYIAGYILEAKLAWGEPHILGEFSIRLTRLKARGSNIPSGIDLN